MKVKATLKQIAKELGVSVSTVSKALNDSPEISLPTKVKIQEFAKLKNYKPNITALNLKNRSTKTIGVIIPNILNSFFAKVFSGIQQVAEHKGYNIITCISNESIEKEIRALQLLSNGTIDGVILSVSEEAQTSQQFDHFSEIIKDGIPIVMFDRVADTVNCDKVIVDDFDSSVHATQHLLNLGCKNLALLSAIDNLSVGKLRAKGFWYAIEKSALAPNKNLAILCNNNDDFDNQIEGIFKNKTIDGIFALDEHSATVAFKKALQLGYKIPEELSIIAFADGVWSRRLTPSLSTISQHGPEIGQAAAELLISKLENDNDEYVYTTKIIKTELRQRDSTRKLSVNK